ncbi:MAG: hypothetical protein QOH96_1996, partial [Blastocatellia bacterium]|nr:hypothetical protein [Blastocatellia bacterium]
MPTFTQAEHPACFTIMYFNSKLKIQCPPATHQPALRLSIMFLNSKFKIQNSKFLHLRFTILFIILNASTIAYTQSPKEKQFHLTASQNLFLEDLSKRSFRFFWEQANPKTGLVPDRARTDGSALDEGHRDVASIASTGFGLTAI